MEVYASESFFYLRDFLRGISKNLSFELLACPISTSLSLFATRAPSKSFEVDSGIKTVAPRSCKHGRKGHLQITTNNAFASFAKAVAYIIIKIHLGSTITPFGNPSLKNFINDYFIGVTMKFPHLLRRLVFSVCLGAIAGAVASAQANELETLYNPTNSANGNVFDVAIGSKALTITGFNISVVGAPTIPIEVYIKNGSWVGAQNSPSAWTLVGSGTVSSAGHNVPTLFDVQDFTLSASSVTGIYITTNAVNNFNYTSGTAVGAIAASNEDLTIFEGAGNFYKFGDWYTPRIWNGSILYSVNAVPEAETYAMLLAGLGLVGAVARRRKCKPDPKCAQ